MRSSRTYRADSESRAADVLALWATDVNLLARWATAPVEAGAHVADGRPAPPAPASATPEQPSSGHTSHSCWLCMRPGHVPVRYVPFVDEGHIQRGGSRHGRRR